MVGALHTIQPNSRALSLAATHAWAEKIVVAVWRVFRDELRLVVGLVVDGPKFRDAQGGGLSTSINSILRDQFHPKKPGSLMARPRFCQLGAGGCKPAVTGEFSNMCTMGLAFGKDIQTDCSINAQLQGKTYCFGSKEAMTQFMADPSGNMAKAQAYYSKKHPG